MDILYLVYCISLVFFQVYTDEISSWLRMEADVDSMRRAISKEFHVHGAHYVFGKGKAFGDWWGEKTASFFAMDRARRIATAAAAAALRSRAQCQEETGAK